MKWMTRLAIMAVFVLGAVTGVTLGMRLERDRFLKMQRNGPAALTEQALKQISSEVKLTPEQREQMRGVLTNAQPALAAAEEERRRKVIGIMESVRSNALAFLDAGQQKLYDVLHQRMKKRLSPISDEAGMAAAVFGG
jgi:Spy/CpxP family protein refolding chaperone